MTENPRNGEDGSPDWEDLQGMWQDSPPVDMAKMARHARFVWWRMRFNFAIEIIFCLIGFVVFGYIADFEVLSTLAFAAFGWLFCGAGIWAALRIRAGAWGEPDGTALSLVQLQIERAKSSIRYVVINTYLGWASGLMIPLALWVTSDQDSGSLANEPRALLYGVFAVLVLFIIIFPLALRSYVRKKKQLIRDLEIVAEQLTGED